MLRNRTDLNHRQLALLAHAVRHPDWEYTTRSHMTSHNVVYATARADLFQLAELGLLDRRRRGRKLNVFLTPPDLEARIPDPAIGVLMSGVPRARSPRSADGPAAQPE